MIIKEVQEISGGALNWKEGSLYPVLTKMEKNKLISSYVTIENGRNRKYYSLNGEETDELRDHLHCQVEELTEVGLSSAEAFEITKMRFGEQQLIRTEYQKAKPMKMLYRYILVGLLLLFALRLVNTLVNYSSTVMFFLMDKWAIPLQTARVVDMGLKGSLIALLCAAIFFGLKRGKINRWLLYSLPFLSIVGDVGIQYVHWQAMQYDHDLYTSLIGTAVMNSRIIMLISYLLLVGFFFLLWHKNGKSLQVSN